MKQRVIVSLIFAVMALPGGCREDKSRLQPPEPSASSYDIAPRKEIIAQNVLAVQLAAQNEFETRATFGPTEIIPASLYLDDSSYVETRRIYALLVRDGSPVEEQSISIGADEKRRDFEFRFAKTPRPSGAYQIRFVEIARSSGKPVLMARLFLTVQ